MNEAVALTTPALGDIAHVRHGFFTREGGVSEGFYASLNGGAGSGDDRRSILENRARMARWLAVAPERMVSLHQTHSCEAVIVDAPFSGERPKADALATATPGLALAIATADCGPVLFADRRRAIVGAAHAGWKGAFTGVLDSAVAAMERLGARRADIVAALGPTIGPASYEVGPEFVARFRQADEALARFFTPSAKDGHAMFDLPAYILMRLARAGVEAIDLARDTYAEPRRFYSYRRSVHRGEADYGRLIAAVAIV